VSEERARHLVLVGMMGAGKSTVGKRCANQLDRAFVDTDEIVATVGGASVAQIFSRDGEAAFRALERTAVADACASPVPAVIAVGGGAVLDADNRHRLRGAGFVVWLHAPVEQLVRHVGDGRTRPLLAGDKQGTLRRLDALRRPAYEAAAHATVDTGGLSLAESADAVLAAFAATVERAS
jgi:shikimate kinase